ncbi:hypothetical protein EDD21DRAFT_425833 [Dissophora ornata]|nr:hypothetical protein BGZ58_004069 [Dissophora ornata]KAI8602900.1 hypothetical protein EDD21DRAFT_425833 [Dissophora ornata]
MADYERIPQRDDDQAGDRPVRKQPILQTRGTLLVATAAIALLATTSYLLGFSNEVSHHNADFNSPGISPDHFALGVAKCKAIRREGRHQYPAPDTRSHNPRFVNGTAPMLFKNGYIFDGVSESFKSDLLIDRGIIAKIGGDIEAPKDAVVVDLKGHILTPGIVDMHSHLGVYSWPMLNANNDFNEMTSPAVPFVRSIDGFSPSDLARERVVSGGVTSVLVLPGSGNVMGGEAFAFKLRKVDTLSAEDMMLEAGVEDKWRYMKMACGENPKRNYGSKGKMPSTRLGEGWVFREQFAKATELKRAQDDWCDAAERLPQFGHHRLDKAFPEDLRYEGLVGILRDDVKLNIHCYETHDIEAMVRHSNEFKFKITAFHHGLDAYRIPAILKRAYRSVPTVATFAGKFGYKKEAFQSSVDSPKILVDAGIPVAMKSDHPILNSQHLVYQASMAHHYGLSELQALASVTSVPARAMGQDHRIGTIAVGMDADLVVWERHPLSLGSHPLQVYIDGVAQIDNVDPSRWTDEGEPLKFKDLPDMAAPKSRDACTTKASDAVFTGIKKIILSGGEEFSSDGRLSVVVRNGEVICTGHCQNHLSTLGNDKEDVPTYDLGGEGVVLPSMLSVGTPNLGLNEIPSEGSTGDGNSNLTPVIVHAVDGLKFGGLHLNEAYKAGILVGVATPVSEHVIQGVSVAFTTGAEDVLSSKDAILKEKVALHVRIGQSSKSSLFPTISSQIAFLRSSLEEGLGNILHPDSEFSLVVRGVIPLIVEVHNRDEIVRLIQIKEDLEHQGAKIKMGLLGATEAWTVAGHLADANISVILSPYHCTPAQWDFQRCLPGAPLTPETGLSVLYKAGVTVGLAAAEFEDVRQMPWIAAWARSDLDISEKEAVGLLSWNLAEIMDLPTGPSGLVIYNGSPFEFGAKVSAIVGGGKSGIQCNPRAF